jgi:hypothetical protein
MKFRNLVIPAAAIALVTCLSAGQSKGSAAQTKNAVAAQAKSAAPKAAVSIFGRNLVKNGNAEAATEDSKKVPGWGSLEGFSVAEYGSVSGEWDWGLSGCAGCGKQYLRLEFEGTTHEKEISQTIDVTPASSDIDQNKVIAKAAVYLGAFHDADTTSQVTISFQDDAGKVLGEMATAPCDTKSLPKAERGSTGLAPYQAGHPVPSGTRKIVYAWKAKATGDSGSYIALGDNFSLELSVPPPPPQH